MKHQTQGKRECKLATIAMLHDIPLSKVRKIACKAVKSQVWCDIIEDVDVFFAGINAVLKELASSEKILMRDDLTSIVLEGSISTDHAKKYLITEDIPLKGKGEMFVHLDYDIHHSVAYENGIIFDSAFEKEYPFDEWLRIIRSHYPNIDYVVV